MPTEVQSFQIKPHHIAIYREKFKSLGLSSAQLEADEDADEMEEAKTSPFTKIFAATLRKMSGAVSTCSTETLTMIGMTHITSRQYLYTFLDHGNRLYCALTRRRVSYGFANVTEVSTPPKKHIRTMYCSYPILLLPLR